MLGLLLKGDGVSACMELEFKFDGDLNAGKGSATDGDGFPFPNDMVRNSPPVSRGERGDSNGDRGLDCCRILLRDWHLPTSEASLLFWLLLVWWAPFAS